MASRRLRAGQLRGLWVCVTAAIVVLALAVAPGSASAASPVLEFVPSGAAFPIPFTANGGPVTAALTDFDSIVECADSHGTGEVTGPHSAVASYIFTGCVAVGATENGHSCESVGAEAEEIKTGSIDAELVYTDQSRHEAAMLLNPLGGDYMEFECGGQSVVALGSFLSPVGPINTQAASFTASLTRSGTLQVPNEYEGANGEKLSAIPMGERNGEQPVPTGVDLSFTVQPSVPLSIRAVSREEIEAKQREEEAAIAAAKKRQGEEAAAAAAAKKRQEDEAAALKLQEEKRARERSQQQRAKSLKQCRKLGSKAKRTRCETRVKKKYSTHPQANKSQ